MSDSLSKILRIVLGILLAISIGLVLWAFSATANVDSTLDVEVQIEQFGSSLEYLLGWTYVLFFATAGGAIVSSIIGLFANKGGLKKAIIPVIGAIVVCAISWSLASDEVLVLPGYTGADNVPETLKWVDASMIVTYIVFFVAAVSIVYSEVVKLVK